MINDLHATSLTLSRALRALREDEATLARLASCTDLAASAANRLAQLIRRRMRPAQLCVAQHRYRVRINQGKRHGR